jgi:Mrp family chromosome partitioning ATPase
VTEESRYSSLRDYLRVLRAQSWLIVLLTLVGGGVATFFSLREESEYTATSKISFETETTNLSIIGTSSGATQTPPAQTPQARTQTIEQPATVRAVRRRLHANVSVVQLQNAIATTLNEDSFLVDVTATWRSPEFAARLANAFTKEAARRINGATRREFRSIRADIEDQIDALGSSPEDQAERVALVNVRARLDFLVETSTPATVVQTAQPASAPISPKPARNTVFGLLLGFTVGILAAFLRDSLDRRLRSAQEIQDTLPYPIVGHIRNEVMGKVVRPDPSAKKPMQENLEAIRIVRQNLEFLDVDSRLRVVLVTSALPEEGKSTVAASLACVNAAFGQSTLLIECDLRRPSLAKRLGLNETPGLTDHLLKAEGVKGVFQSVEVASALPSPSPNGAGNPTLAGPGRLDCITAGTLTPQPAELLKSKRFKTFLDGASANYDMVILDTSPLLPVADTLALLPLADRVLLCVRANQSTSDQVRAARTALEHFPKRPTGVVVTGLKRRDAASYGYYSYGKPDRATAPRAEEKTPA